MENSLVIAQPEAATIQCPPAASPGRLPGLSADSHISRRRNDLSGADDPSRKGASGLTAYAGDTLHIVYAIHRLDQEPGACKASVCGPSNVLIGYQGHAGEAHHAGRGRGPDVPR